MSDSTEKNAVDQVEVTTLKYDEQIEPLDRELERKLVRKVDWKLIPPLCFLLMAAFIDRVNIGNARLLGLESDLNMHGNQYNIALFIFFVPYILLEVPANLFMRKLRPSMWLSALILGWGIMTICQGLTRSFGGLVACRFLIGVFEAGFFPGAIYLISMYYKRLELSVRLNIFFSSSIFAGGFSGLLAYAIGHMDGLKGYKAWRWVFILEGVATALLAILSYFMIPDWPETAQFLKPEERKLLLMRLSHDAGPAHMDTYNRKAIKRVFLDIKIYLGFLMFLACTVTSYSMSLFIPTILHDFGWSVLHTQVMTIPVYVVAGVYCIITAFGSDYAKHRCLFILGNFFIALVAWIILINGSHVAIGVRYMAIFFTASATQTALPITIAWVNNNMGSGVKRGIAAGLQVGLGNSGGIIASNVFLKRESPWYHTGYSVGIAALCLGITACAVFFGKCYFENKKRDRGERDYLLQLPEQEVRDLGDDHPAWRYTY